MNWVLGLIGALVGVGVAESRELLGAVVGFFSMYLLLSVNRLRGELATMSREMAVTKARIAALSATAASPPAAAPAAPAAPVAVPAAAPPMAATPASPSEEVPVPIADAARAAEPPISLAAERAADASAEQVSEPASAAPPPAATPRPPPRAPVARAVPGWEDKLIARVKSWFTEGNMPVKIGVLVLLFGVAAALRYAAAQGYFTMPIEVRLALIAGGAIIGLGLGWRERIRRPAFGLSLQGGALGVLLLTVFAAFRLYKMLPPTLAFALIVVIVAGAALLAVLQQNMALAVLGFLGGYLAPVLISTGSANHVALFSYYAVLNAAVFAISWRQNWRLLNLIGFLFTFGVGTAWGSKYYRPELFASVEPFLVLFFLFYIVIGLLYVVRQTEHRRPWVDGTLVFGTPLVAFPLQAAMLKDDRIGMAFSALAVALIYAALVYWLRQRRGERLLTEAYGALALGFATLAVPLAFSASTTASVWALEGAGVAWLGLRQNRNFPWLAGLALQVLAAGSYCLSLMDRPYNVTAPDTLLLLNAEWLGAAILSFSGFALALIHDRHYPRFLLAPLLFSWAAFWWCVAALTQLDLAEQGIGQWRFCMLYLVVSVGSAALLRDRLTWPRLNWLIALSTLAGFLLVFAAEKEYGAPLATPSLTTWAVYLLALAWALWSARDSKARSLAFAHLAALWTIALALTMHLSQVTDDQGLAQGWEFIAVVTPIALLSLGLWRRPAAFSWPRAEQFADYRMGWFAPALVLMMYAFIVGLFEEGSATPLIYLPLFNPMELAMIGLAALVYGLCGDMGSSLQPLRKLWPLLAFAFVTMATLRAVHHIHGEPWTAGILNSGFSQASLTVVWSLLGVSAWILGSRRRDRQIWMGGAVLMGVVLIKLLFVDRGYMGNMPGIISFMAVGLLLVGVGYIAPSPPKLQESGESA
jgi:uncharacterized membrane protein